MLTKVKFLARFTELDSDGREFERFMPTSFNLGIGPCGKDVVEIATACNETGTLFGVVQECSDGSKKSFTYKMTDIYGRIEETYNATN